MMPIKEANALVMAAGAASRFGVPKVLLPAGAGHTLLSRVLSLALGAVSGRVAVVLGREAGLAQEELRRWLSAQETSLQARVTVVVNQAYGEGRSSTLKTGLHALVPDAPVLVLLADQPLLQAKGLQELISAYGAGGVVAAAAAVRGEQRSPVLLGPALFAEIMQLTGDAGAKGVLRQQDELALIDWEEGPWSQDIDTWQDYEALALAQGWQDELTPSLPVLSAVPPELLEAARRAASVMLAPGVRFMPYPAEAALYELAEGDLPDASALVSGSAYSPRDYLALLRQASLTLLRRRA